ncbi:MAG: sulfotransferase, partial [Gammaproteobacteria bacterium]|nr:sulfotransferase [Gammaproteobacteria bacterium]
MIVKPVLIIGAPRSGTSLLQKILRDHPVFWSLPSESDMIWDQYCHPSLHGWDSESLDEHDMTPEARANLLREFEKYMCPAGFWKPLQRTGMIWDFRRRPAIRRMLRNVYRQLFPLMQIFFRNENGKRLIEKTASNCFRLGYVNEVFPDARIIYPVRDGRNTVNSLINGWLHPNRFFTYDVPEKIHIKDYPHGRWKFVLPPGWRDYVNRPLAEVCAFQWRACHEAMLAETAKPKYQGRVLRVKLEQIVAEPDHVFRRIAEFIEVPYDE